MMKITPPCIGIWLVSGWMVGLLESNGEFQSLLLVKGGRRKFLISLTFFFNLGILFFRKKSSMPLVCPKNKQLEGGNGCFLFSFVCWIRWYVFFKKSTHRKSVALKSIWKIENLREKVISHPYNMSNLDKFSSVTTMIVVVTHDITSMGFE